jgi:Ca2+-binding EF-hand superfamily protein
LLDVFDYWDKDKNGLIDVVEMYEATVDRFTKLCTDEEYQAHLESIIGIDQTYIAYGQ